MSQIPLRRKPAFRALALASLLLASYVFGFAWQGGVLANAAAVGLDLVLLLLVLQFCIFYFAQFIVPVRTLADRLRIRGRLIMHSRNAHGPAILVKNGRKVERRRESSRSGPGLLWIDTASAVLTRSDTAPKQVLGPGVHFLSAGERIASIFSLHPQTLSIGPNMDEPIFERLEEESTEEERRQYAALQAKRVAVSGITRDGNEVVPEIQVVFRLDGSPAASGSPGSRFGYLKESVERAARGEGVTVDPTTARQLHVAWNQLPGLIAVDLWREYLAKFTLDELFSARFRAPPDVLQPEQPVPPEAFPPAPSVPGQGWPARKLWQLNNFLEERFKTADDVESMASSPEHTPRSAAGARKFPGREYTALQIIGQMVRARMMQAAVPILDDFGRPTRGHTISEEFKRLRERGLRILDVTLGGFRFDPAVEQQIVQQWRTAWLATATSDRGRVEQLELLAAQDGRQKALLEHAAVLARAVEAQKPSSIPATLKVLLRSAQHEILTDERLHGRGREELGSLSRLTKWVESAGDD
jgi:hypothetical protein